MRFSSIVVLSSVAVLAVAGAATFPVWKPLLWPDPGVSSKTAPHQHDDTERVKISPQARANLGLRVQRVDLVTEPYWRMITVPAQVIEYPGSCERLVTAPLGGIVKQLGAVRGDLVRPGDPLFTLQVVNEQVHTAQTSLYKTRKEWEMAEAERKRILEPFKNGAIPMARMVEVENNVQRLSASLKALEHELVVRGFTPKDISLAMAGEFVTRLTVPTPPFTGHAHGPFLPMNAGNAVSVENGHPVHDPVYEVEELKVLLGEQVQPGQALCLLADHNVLHIEGRVFASEIPWIQQAAAKGWTVRAELPAENEKAWPSWNGELKIAFLANRVDPANQTLSFYLQVANRNIEYSHNGKTYRLWRFRPGQRLTLRVPVESFQGVFVLPADAVVRQGPEAFVFRENGDFFERKPVHVLFEDRSVAVIADDGSIFPGTTLALNAAAQLNWALKTQGQSEGAHEHHHEH